MFRNFIIFLLLTTWHTPRSLSSFSSIKMTNVQFLLPVMKNMRNINADIRLLTVNRASGDYMQLRRQEVKQKSLCQKVLITLAGDKIKSSTWLTTKWELLQQTLRFVQKDGSVMSHYHGNKISGSQQYSLSNDDGNGKENSKKAIGL